MSKTYILIATSIILTSCGIIPVYPSFKYSDYIKKECVLTKSFYLRSTRVTPVQKHPYEAVSTDSTVGNYPFTLEKGTIVKVISIVNIDYGYGNYSRKARLEYITEANESIKFEMSLDSYEKLPFVLRK